MRYLSAAGRCAVGLRDGSGRRRQCRSQGPEQSDRAAAGLRRASLLLSPRPCASKVGVSAWRACGIATPRYLRSVPGARRDACRRGAGKVGSGHGPWPCALLVGLRAGTAPAAAAALRSTGIEARPACGAPPPTPAACRPGGGSCGSAACSLLRVVLAVGTGHVYVNGSYVLLYFSAVRKVQIRFESRC